MLRLASKRKYISDIGFKFNKSQKGFYIVRIYQEGLYEMAFPGYSKNIVTACNNLIQLNHRTWTFN